MIDFTSAQLSWIVITMATVGGGGYLNMYQKIDELDKKVAVVSTSMSYTEKSLNDLKSQLDRIEDKITLSKKDK
jgi:septal ring factor EnvC (AmiA/AmiB activator)